MFVKSEFPLDSALVFDSDKKNWVEITHVRYNKTATSIKMSSPKLNFADGQYSIELKHWK